MLNQWYGMIKRHQITEAIAKSHQAPE
ncbi:hypothetical protein [Bacillus paralicheniformis]